MKHLLPLFLMFSFSAKATIFSKETVRCFSLSKKKKQPTPDELIRVQERVRDELASVKTKNQATPDEITLALTFLKKELLNSFSPKYILEILKQLEKKDFSEEDINNIIMSVLLDPKLDQKGELRTQIAQGQLLAHSTLGKVTPYQALQLLYLDYLLKDYNITTDKASKALEDSSGITTDKVSKALENYSITATEVAKTLQDIGKFSKKGIIAFIIQGSNSYYYDFGRNLRDELVRGEWTALKILKKPVTPRQALGLFLLEKELKEQLADNPKIPKKEIISKALEGLNFSEKDINKLINSISDNEA